MPMITKHEQSKSLLLDKINRLENAIIELNNVPAFEECREIVLKELNSLKLEFTLNNGKPEFMLDSKGLKKPGIYYLIKKSGNQEKIIDYDENFNSLVYWHNKLMYDYQDNQYCIKLDDVIVVDWNKFAKKTKS